MSDLLCCMHARLVATVVHRCRCSALAALFNSRQLDMSGVHAVCVRKSVLMLLYQNVYRPTARCSLFLCRLAVVYQVVADTLSGKFPPGHKTRTYVYVQPYITYIITYVTGHPPARAQHPCTGAQNICTKSTT